MEKINLNSLDLIIADGYANFGTERVSLGQAVYETYAIPIIGIVKKYCKHCILTDTEVFRGGSSSPLFVILGISQSKARNIVRAMNGEHRLPYLAKLADSYARGNL